LDFITN
jgi:hypothetical protein